MEIVSGRDPLNVLPMGMSDKIRERECADQCNDQAPERKEGSLDFSHVTCHTLHCLFGFLAPADCEGPDPSLLGFSDSCRPAPVIG